MAISLNVENKLNERLIPMEMEYREINASENLSSDRHLELKVERSACTSDVVSKLNTHGFREVPKNVAQFIDLKRFPDFEEYIKGLTHNCRKTVNKALREIGEKAEWVFTESAKMSASELSALHSDIVLPFCSAHQIDPYQVDRAQGFLKVLTELDRSRSWVVQLKLEGRVLAVIFLELTTAGKHFEKKGCPLTGEHVWSRAIGRDELVMNGQLYAIRPMGHEDADALVPNLIYWRTVKWAYENKCTICTFGFDDRKIFTEQYLGVLRFKRRWLSSAAAVWDSNQRHFIRVSAKRTFLERKDLAYFHGEKSSPGFTYHLFSNIGDQEICRILRPDTSFKPEISVLNESDRSKWTEAQNEFKDLKVSVLNPGNLYE